jgi:hypothetical protein
MAYLAVAITLYKRTMKKVLAVLALAIFLGGISATAIAATVRTSSTYQLYEEEKKADEKKSEAKTESSSKKSGECSKECTKSKECTSEKTSDCSKSKGETS